MNTKTWQDVTRHKAGPRFVSICRFPPILFVFPAKYRVRVNSMQLHLPTCMLIIYRCIRCSVVGDICSISAANFLFVLVNCAFYFFTKLFIIHGQRRAYELLQVSFAKAREWNSWISHMIVSLDRNAKIFIYIIIVLIVIIP